MGHVNNIDTRYSYLPISWVGAGVKDCMMCVWLYMQCIHTEGGSHLDIFLDECVVDRTYVQLLT